MKRISRIVLLMLAMGVMPFAGTIMPVSAQNTDTIRYVHPNGVYTNDGKSWETPFNRVQDAINSLHDYLNTYNLHSGSVYIAAGTYVPTESTEGAGGSMLNTSFKIDVGKSMFAPANFTTSNWQIVFGRVQKSIRICSYLLILILIKYM